MKLPPNSTLILQSFGLQLTEVSQYFEEEIEFDDLDLTRLSFFLKCQLVYAEKANLFYPPTVRIAIDNIENPSQTHPIRGPEPFRHDPLKGFWKAHFYDAVHMKENLVNAWKLSFPDSGKLDAMIQKHRSSGDPKWSDHAAKEFMNALMQKSSKGNLTGEWIIFKKVADVPWYLAVANHTSGQEQDSKLMSILRTNVQPEYPFLF